MNYIQQHNFIPESYLLNLTKALPPLEPEHWDRYDNPFERKWVLPRPALFTTFPLPELVRLMQSAMLAQYGRSNVMIDIDHHYTALMVYQPGDYLRIHVDAGIHPISKHKKYVTLLLYFTPAELIFWQGSLCTAASPEFEPFVVDSIVDTIKAQPRDLIMFNNTDASWHSVPTTETTRMVLTISGVTMQHWLPVEEQPLYNNPRERAYFVPNPNEQWSDDLIALRNRRADPTLYKEVYKV